MPTDAELRDAALEHLKLTTIGYVQWADRVANGYKGKPYDPAMTEWGKGLALLEQIGGVVEPPPPEPEPEPPPPPPPDVNYPASYFAGPLGNKNPLPAKLGAFLIAWLGMPGGATTWDQFKQRVALRESQMGRKFDGIMITDFQSEWPDNRMAWIRDHGSIPIVAGLNFGGHDGVLNGSKNSVIDAFADRYKALGVTMMIRLHHEFNYSHLSYTSVGQEAKFIASWKFIVDRFKARGASNVGFWWCPAEGGSGGERASADAAYPGDNYVDWVGSDQYNHCLVGQSGCYSTPWEPGYASFGKLFDYSELGGRTIQSRHDKYGPRKPFVVGETGTKFDPAVPGRKGQWFRELPANAKAMEYLRGVAFFDVDASPWEPGNNWLVDYPTNVPENLAGFVAMAKDPWFNTRA